MSLEQIKKLRRTILERKFKKKSTFIERNQLSKLLQDFKPKAK